LRIEDHQTASLSIAISLHVGAAPEAAAWFSERLRRELTGAATYRHGLHRVVGVMTHDMLLLQSVHARNKSTVYNTELLPWLLSYFAAYSKQ